MNSPLPLNQSERKSLVRSQRTFQKEKGLHPRLHARDLDKKLDQIVDDFIKSLNAKPIPPFNEADYEDVDYSRRFVGQVELSDTTNLEQT